MAVNLLLYFYYIFINFYSLKHLLKTYSKHFQNLFNRFDNRSLSWNLIGYRFMSSRNRICSVLSGWAEVETDENRRSRQTAVCEVAEVQSFAPHMSDAVHCDS